MNRENQYREILVRDIENGMVLSKDVLDPSGGRLLVEGFEIKDAAKIKRLLNQYKIISISILKKESEFVIKYEPKEKVADETKVNTINNQALKDSINRFNENTETLKKSFDRFVKGESINQYEIEKEIKNALNLFNRNINVFQLMQSVKHLDDITYSHCHNVALISYSIGQLLELKENDLHELALSGMLMDIGKIQIDDKLLNKEGLLTNDELLELKKHAIFSHEIIKDYDFISDRVKKAVLYHHERMDGSGYPLGIKGDKIPLFARIVAIADVYNALISHRPYRSKKTPFEAIRILETEYMDKLDTNILYLFLRRVTSNYIGQGVKLSDGSKGQIIFIPKHSMFHPIIQLENQEDVLDLGNVQYSHLDVIEFC